MDAKLTEAIKKAETLADELEQLVSDTAKTLLDELRDGVETYADLEGKLRQVRRSALWSGHGQRDFLRAIFNRVDLLIAQEKNGLPIIQELRTGGKQVLGQVVEISGWKEDIEALEKRVAALEEAQERPEAGVIRISVPKFSAEQVQAVANGLHSLMLQDGKVYLDGFRVRGVTSYELKRDHITVPRLRLEIGISNKNLEAFLGKFDSNVSSDLNQDGK